MSILSHLLLIFHPLLNALSRAIFRGVIVALIEVKTIFRDQQSIGIVSPRAEVKDDSRRSPRTISGFLGTVIFAPGQLADFLLSFSQLLNSEVYHGFASFVSLSVGQIRLDVKIFS